MTTPDHLEVPTVDPISVLVPPSVHLLKDIAITAAEGAIDYWCVLHKYQWRESAHQCTARLAANNEGADPEAVEGLRRDLPFPVLRLQYENPDSDSPPTITVDVTPEHIRKGLQLALTAGVLDPTCNTVRSAVTALFTDDAGAVDADAADNIIQLGIFGKLVFG